jgi:cyclopropane fatty-acyl-phospholipid synthase-like methyltransferase
VSLRREAEQQYLTTDPLKVRIETHSRYSERQVDLDSLCHSELRLEGAERVLDAGCGPGAFMSYLRRLERRAKSLSGCSVAAVDEIAASILGGDLA